MDENTWKIIEEVSQKANMDLQRTMNQRMEEETRKTSEEMRGITDRQNSLHSRFTQMEKLLVSLARHAGLPEALDKEVEEAVGSKEPQAQTSKGKEVYVDQTPVASEHQPEQVSAPKKKGKGIGQTREPEYHYVDEVPNFDDPVVQTQLRINPLYEQKDEIQELREKIKAIEGFAKFPGVDLSQLTLVPGLVLPPKFKMPDFEMFNGTQNPVTHLSKYQRKMANYVMDDKIMIHCFQDSLVGGAAEWYANLDKADITTWNDLANTFAAYYKHNAEMDPTRDTLRAMERKHNETFKEYARRWRETAARVKPSLANDEFSAIFIKTLKNPYHDRLWMLSGDDLSTILRK